MTKISRTKHVTSRGVVKRNPPKKNSSSKEQVFAGHWTGTDIDGKKSRISFNLYGAEEINFDETKEALIDNMNNRHLPKLRQLFAKTGLQLKRLQWYSPKAYNYGGDSIDLVITIKDRNLLTRFIRAQAKDIQKTLDSNKSYDGFIATTSSDVQEVLDKLDRDFDLDIMIVNYILSKYSLDEYEDYYDLFVNESEDD